MRAWYALCPLVEISGGLSLGRHESSFFRKIEKSWEAERLIAFQKWLSSMELADCMVVYNKVLNSWSRHMSWNCNLNKISHACDQGGGCDGQTGSSRHGATVAAELRKGMLSGTLLAVAVEGTVFGWPQSQPSLESGLYRGLFPRR
jgi:hypothetical protein